MATCLVKTIHDSVIGDGVLPDDSHLMEEDELKSFARMCRRFEKYLDQKVISIANVLH